MLQLSEKQSTLLGIFTSLNRILDTGDTGVSPLSPSFLVALDWRKFSFLDLMNHRNTKLRNRIHRLDSPEFQQIGSRSLNQMRFKLKCFYNFDVQHKRMHFTYQMPCCVDNDRTLEQGIPYLMGFFDAFRALQKPGMGLLTTITIDEPAPGLKTIFSFKVPDQRSGKVELQYQHEHAGISTSLGLTANPIVNFSGVIGSNVVSLGTDLSFDTATGNFTKYNAGLSYANADLIASLTVNDKGDTLTASYYHTVRPLTSTAVGAELTRCFSSNENTLTIGTQHALDPLTTVKARLNNYGKASALIQHEWRPKSLFTISGEVDTKAVEKSAKIGLALALKP
ncbi:hypothetical protein D5086_017129 [Populus alba]|uniref:Uncharacterized protein n=1 Tax=Populus alba TaxID=43335 RepID=A0ACC4BWF6_POPAL